LPLPAIELEDFLQAERLPESYRQQVECFFLPFIDALEVRIRQRELRTLGIHGAQGSGKSTLASFFAWYLKQRGFSVAQVSLDDFYLRRDERRALGESIHPLLATRGVPGTHDISLALNTLSQLRDLPAGQSLPVPRFDKLNDDRYPESEWPLQVGEVDLIIFEGWCLGAVAQAEDELSEPVNELERQEDPDGSWRRYVNGCLGGDYQTLFAELDYLMMLEAPSFGCVAGWRLEQELRLAEREPGKSVMSAADVARFVQHYERITRHCLKTLPERANCVMMMAEDRTIAEACYRGRV
jgi:D-glycerate 3-kinase